MQRNRYIFSGWTVPEPSPGTREKHQRNARARTRVRISTARAFYWGRGLATVSPERFCTPSPGRSQGAGFLRCWRCNTGNQGTNGNAGKNAEKQRGFFGGFQHPPRLCFADTTGGGVTQYPPPANGRRKCRKRRNGNAPGGCWHFPNFPTRSKGQFSEFLDNV